MILIHWGPLGLWARCVVSLTPDLEEIGIIPASVPKTSKSYSDYVIHGLTVTLNYYWHDRASTWQLVSGRYHPLSLGNSSQGEG